MKINIKNMTNEELGNFFQNLGEEKYRGKQVFKWLNEGVYSFDEMSNIPKSIKEKLSEEAFIEKLKMLKKQESTVDGTIKFLFQLSDGNTIESVFMKYKFGNSLCISSQAGCRMGCIFCASAIGGLKRNLLPSEMLDQLIMTEKETGEKINNLVVMGTGEPFDNYDNLCKFLAIIHDPQGINMGLRNITVSTCGLISGIKRFAEDFPQVNLAISLHGPNDTIRENIMPINKRYNVNELLRECRWYTETTGRRITFEYALINKINDGVEHAEELARKLKGMNCHVNLIPLNHISESGLKGSNGKAVKSFKEILEKRGIQVTVRREMGSDIDGACGQLRATTKL